MHDTSPDQPPGDSSNDLTGRVLGDYRLLRRLGQGAMAEVYLAEQRSLSRQVALKVLKSNLATDETYLKRFELEARAAASLVHASIVQIYEVGCIDGVHFIAQEYVQGQDLGELLRRRGTFPLNEAASIMRQVAAALAKAAEHGIVHRDIKPENLMLSRGGEIKVADFGLARITEGNEQQKLTQVGITMGSPLYMSPEQAEGKALDTRSDIYSFGATCYEMLAGQPPFEGETALAVAVQHVKSEPPPLAQLRPDLPAELCQLIHRMLAKTPDERQENGAELLRELRRLPIEQPAGNWPEALDTLNTSETAALSTVRQAATQHLARVMRDDTVPRPVYRRPLVWLGAVAAIVIGVWLALPTDEAPLLGDLSDATNSITTNRVQQRNTAQQQYLAALQANTEAAFLSVESFFPNDTRYVDLASRQLATRYLDQDRLIDAKAIFDEFASRAPNDGSSNADEQLYGQAGQYLVLSLLGKSEAATDALTQLISSEGGRAGESSPLDRLIQVDRTLARRVAAVMRVDMASIRDQAGLEAPVRRWLEENFSDPAAG